MKLLSEIKNTIIETSKILDKPLTDKDFYILHQPLKHKPKSLPDNSMAVYTFVYKGEFLKIGQANYKSKARYQSHHYNPGSAISTLAGSLLNDDSMKGLLNRETVTQWIKDNCERFDVIIDKKHGKKTLNFIEGLLHYKYDPKYEG